MAKDFREKKKTRISTPVIEVIFRLQQNCRDSDAAASRVSLFYLLLDDYMKLYDYMKSGIFSILPLGNWSVSWYYKCKSVHLIVLNYIFYTLKICFYQIILLSLMI